VRPGLIEVLAGNAPAWHRISTFFPARRAVGAAPMRRFGDGDRFLALIEQIRKLAPEAGIRSNFIVGFPGENGCRRASSTLPVAAEADAIGLRISDEDARAADVAGKLGQDAIAERVERVAGLADELMGPAAPIGSARFTMCSSTSLLTARTASASQHGVDHTVSISTGVALRRRAAHQAPEWTGATGVRSPRQLPLATSFGCGYQV